MEISFTGKRALVTGAGKGTETTSFYSVIRPSSTRILAGNTRTRTNRKNRDRTCLFSGALVVCCRATHTFKSISICCRFVLVLIYVWSIIHGHINSSEQHFYSCVCTTQQNQSEKSQILVQNSNPDWKRSHFWQMQNIDTSCPTTGLPSFCWLSRFREDEAGWLFYTSGHWDGQNHEAIFYFAHADMWYKLIF